MLYDVLTETQSVTESLKTEFHSQLDKFGAFAHEYREQNRKMAFELDRATKQLGKLAKAADHMERSLILISELFDDHDIERSHEEICCEVKRIVDIFEKADTKSLHAYGRERLAKAGYVQNKSGKFVRPIEPSFTDQERPAKKAKVVGSKEIEKEKKGTS